jgi:hypothetical protein
MLFFNFWIYGVSAMVEDKLFVSRNIVLRAVFPTDQIQCNLYGGYWIYFNLLNLSFVLETQDYKNHSHTLDPNLFSCHLCFVKFCE